MLGKNIETIKPLKKYFEKKTALHITSSPIKDNISLENYPQKTTMKQKDEDKNVSD